MRRTLAWTLAVPLMLAGSQLAHVVAYLWAYPSAPVRARALLSTGHAYLGWAPLVLGLGGAVALVSLLLTAVDAGRGRSPRALPAWAFALVPPLGFALQEHLERLLATGAFPWDAALAPTFLRGLLLQAPFALAAYLVARLLLRAAVRVGVVVARRAPPRPRRSSSSPAWPAAEPVFPRACALALRRAERGPPLLVPA
ncbi:MAG TPA: hypothetical protein VFL66_02565 [Gaiellaceae bacterium]|nr:hypothetical protein [Gaiellaceae bacterium]